MRLLCFAQQFTTFTSGLGTYARALVHGLVQRGHQVTLAAPRAQCEPVEGVRLVPMDFSPGNLTPFAMPRMMRSYRAVLRRELSQHDVAHFLDAREAVFGFRSATPVVGSLHDAYALDWCAPEYPRHLHDDRVARGVYYAWLRLLERAAYRVPVRFAANSAHVRDRVARGYRVPVERIEVIPLGLPVPVPTEPARLGGAPAVLFVGGNFRRKGLLPLVEAFARLRRSLPEAHLHVVGSDPRQQVFRDRVRQLGIEDRVTFYGWQPNGRVRSMMAGATVFAMPSLVEAFGFVYLEAMWAKTPVIASATGGTVQAFRDGEDALLVPPCDVDALAIALEQASRNSALRERLIAGGVATVARYPVESTVIRTERLFAQVAAGR
jgi:glycosyltransferase involved in cell wall biosynthesis